MFVDTADGILGTNMYTYCQNDPVNSYDPSGMSMLDLRATLSFMQIISPVLPDIIEIGIAFSPLFFEWLGPVVDAYGPLLFAEKAATVAPKAAEKAANTTNAVVSSKGWKLGDDPNKLTKAGNPPSWTTVRNRVWKNDAFYNPGSSLYDRAGNLARAQKGLSPLDAFGNPYELHHIVWRSQGGTHALSNLEPLTRVEHWGKHYGPVMR